MFKKYYYYIKKGRKKKEPRDCIVCGKSFIYKHIRHKCCSRECGIKLRDKEVDRISSTCDICSKKLTQTKYKYEDSKNHFCSRKCYGQSMKISMCGKNNPMWGKTHTREVKERLASFCLRNNMGGGQMVSKAGKRVDLNNVFFRSSWEANYARILNKLGKRWEFEPKQFFFPEQKRGPISYCPDFKVYNEDNDYEWIEIKGWFDSKSKSKLKKFNKFYPEEYSKLRLIDGKGYNNLIKEYSKQIPTWEYPDEQIRKTAVDTYRKRKQRNAYEIQINQYLQKYDGRWMFVNGVPEIDCIVLSSEGPIALKFKYGVKRVNPEWITFKNKIKGIMYKVVVFGKVETSEIVL